MQGDVPGTERRNEAWRDLDTLDTPTLVERIASDQRDAIDAVLAAHEDIARVVDEVTRRLAGGGRLHYVGAGTSGRLGVLDASEMPPTFGVAPDLVCAHIAGGSPALVHAVEGAEDDGEAGAREMDGHVHAGDAVIGISASGGARYVVHALAEARSAGAYTVAVVNSASSALAQAADVAIVLDTGPEVITGSTRLKAGTSQKIALNTISTAVMVRRGKVYENLMVDVVATNDKLRARAVGLVRTIAGVSDERARDLLKRANGRVKVAVVMERLNVDEKSAASLLDEHRGFLRNIL